MKPSNLFHNTPTPTEENLWSTSDLSKFLRCSERQVFNLRQQGLPAVQVGGLIRFIPSRVRDWLDSRDLGHDASDERSRQLNDIAASGDEDNAEVCRAELERHTFDGQNCHLPFEGKLTRSLLGRIPTNINTMKLSANGSTTPFEAHPEYDGQAVCVDVTELRKTQIAYGERETFRVVFETRELRQDGRPFLLFSRGFTPSLHEKAAFRAFLRQWFGRELTTAELERPRHREPGRPAGAGGGGPE
jgi:hypothetical protein